VLSVLSWRNKQVISIMFVLPTLPYAKYRTLSCSEFVTSDRKQKQVLKEILGSLRCDDVAKVGDGVPSLVELTKQDDTVSKRKPCVCSYGACCYPCYRRRINRMTTKYHYQYEVSGAGQLEEHLRYQMPLEELLENNFDHLDFSVAMEEMIAYVQAKLKTLKHLPVIETNGKMTVNCKASLSWAPKWKMELTKLVIDILLRYCKVIEDRIEFLNGFYCLFQEDLMGIRNRDYYHYDSGVGQDFKFNSELILKLFFDSVVVQEVDGLNRLWNMYIREIFNAALTIFVHVHDTGEEDYEVPCKSKKYDYYISKSFDVSLHELKAAAKYNGATKSYDDAFDWKKIPRVFQIWGFFSGNYSEKYPSYMNRETVFPLLDLTEPFEYDVFPNNSWGRMGELVLSTYILVHRLATDDQWSNYIFAEGVDFEARGVRQLNKCIVSINKWSDKEFVSYKPLRGQKLHNNVTTAGKKAKVYVNNVQVRLFIEQSSKQIRERCKMVFHNNFYNVFTKGRIWKAGKAYELTYWDETQLQDNWHRTVNLWKLNTKQLRLFEDHLLKDKDRNSGREPPARHSAKRKIRDG
jgi:hypothetical protein